MGIDQGLHAEHLLQQVGGEHLGRRSDRQQAPAVEHAETVAEGRRQVEVVKAGQGRQPQRLDLPQQLQLVAWVEVVGRLVENQQLRLLHQGPRQQRTLLLAAGQAGERLLRQLAETDPRQRLADQALVLGIVAALAKFAAKRRPLLLAAILTLAAPVVLIGVGALTIDLVCDGRFECRNSS